MSRREELCRLFADKRSRGLPGEAALERVNWAEQTSPSYPRHQGVLLCFFSGSGDNDVPLVLVCAVKALHPASGDSHGQVCSTAVKEACVQT